MPLEPSTRYSYVGFGHTPFCVACQKLIHDRRAHDMWHEGGYGAWRPAAGSAIARLIRKIFRPSVTSDPSRGFLLAGGDENGNSTARRTHDSDPQHGHVDEEQRGETSVPSVRTEVGTEVPQRRSDVRKGVPLVRVGEHDHPGLDRTRTFAQELVWLYERAEPLDPDIAEEFRKSVADAQRFLIEPPLTLQGPPALCPLDHGSDKEGL